MIFFDGALEKCHNVKDEARDIETKYFYITFSFIKDLCYSCVFYFILSDVFFNLSTKLNRLLTKKANKNIPCFLL